MLRLIVVLLGFTAFPLMAQQSKIDSLKTALEAASDTLKVNIRNNLAFEVVFSDPGEAERLALQSIDEAISLDYPKGLLGGYRILGISFDLRSEYVKAIDAYKKGIPIANILDDPSQKASLLNVLGVAYYHLSQYNLALEQLLEALKLAEGTNNPRHLANIYTNIGLVYHDLNDLDKALDYYERSTIQAEKAGDLRLQGRISNNIGIILNTKGLYDGAKIYYEQSLSFKEKVNDELGLSATQQNLAVVYKNLGNLDKANELLEKARATKELMGDQIGLIQVYDTKIGILIGQKRLREAEELMAKSKSILEKIEAREPYINLYNRYKEFYAAKGQYEMAEVFQNRKDSVREALINETRITQLATLQSLYELDKKETEIKLLQNERDRQNLQQRITLISGAGGLLVVILLGGWYYQRQNQQRIYFESQRKLHEAEIQNAQLREGELKRELEFKNRELTSYTINFVQKGQLIEDLKDNLDQIINSSETDLVGKLTPLKKVVESNYQIDKEWDDFKLRFEEVHSGFFEQLKASYPELSNSDLRLCALLRLNMTMKEAAKILGISVDSVKTSRYRLRKKLNLETDDNLNDFIMQFSSNNMKA